MPEAWGALGTLAGIWLFFRLVSAAAGFAVSGSGIMGDFGLFTVSHSGWFAFKIIWRILSFICCWAALLGTAAWYCGDERNSVFRRLSAMPMGKWLGLCVVAALARFVPLLAGGACFYGAYEAFHTSFEIYTGNGEYLLLAVCLAALGICMLCYCLYINVLLVLCPFIMAVKPQTGIFAAMRLSAGAMRGGIWRIIRFAAAARSIPVFFMMLAVYAGGCNLCHRRVTG